jgi:sugar lactone lactonase YvrE
MKRALLGLAVAGLVVGQGPGVAAAPAVPDPGDLDHASVVAELPSGDFGAFGESMAPDGRGGVIVSVTSWGPEDGSASNMGQLWRVGMDGTMTKLGPRMDLSPAGMLMGVAVDEQGRVFVALNNFGSDYGMEEDPPSGVLRVTPGNARRVLTLPVDAVPNGLAAHEGRLFVTDSFGSIWTGSTRGAPEQADRWFTSPLLEPVSEFGMGANGITFRQGSLYVTSYEQGAIVRIPVRRNGAAGAPTVLAADESLVGADGIAFDRNGRLWVAVNGELDWYNWVAIDPGRIVTIDQTGAVTPVLTPAGALDYPTQVLPGQHGALLVVNGSFLFGAPQVVAFTG